MTRQARSLSMDAIVGIVGLCIVVIAVGVMVVVLGGKQDSPAQEEPEVAFVDEESTRVVKEKLANPKPKDRPKQDKAEKVLEPKKVFKPGPPKKKIAPTPKPPEKTEKQKKAEESERRIKEDREKKLKAAKKALEDGKKRRKKVFEESVESLAVKLSKDFIRTKMRGAKLSREERQLILDLQRKRARGYVHMVRSVAKLSIELKASKQAYNRAMIEMEQLALGWGQDGKMLPSKFVRSCLERHIAAEKK
jgi:type IV secretory pathway VirB10-like protein